MTLKSASKSVFHINYSNGFKDGKSILEHADGSKYNLEFKNDQANGRLQIDFNDGSQLNGYYAKNILNNNLKLNIPNTLQFEITFNENPDDGVGEIILNNGTIHSGIFNHGKRNGEGIDS